MLGNMVIKFMSACISDHKINPNSHKFVIVPQWRWGRLGLGEEFAFGLT